MSVVEKLSVCRALREVSRAALDALASHAREVEYEEGERIVPLLTPLRTILVVTEGLAKLVGVSSNGVERIVYVFRPGDITGSRVLLDSAEASYETVAITSVEGVEIDKRDLLTAGRDHPEILLAITREFSRRLAQLTRRVMSAMSEDVPVRLSQLLLDFSDPDGLPEDEYVPLIYPLTHETMAQIIGASRPHTSTVLGDLEEAGAVHRHGRKGLTVNVARLRKIVEGGEVEEKDALLEVDRIRRSAMRPGEPA